MKSLLRSEYFLLAVLCGLLFLPFLGYSVLWDYDEGYFAAIGEEMFEKGAWIVPTFNDCELGDKPILLFWGMLVSFSVFGISEFAVRFPSILYGTATVFMTYLLARRLFPGRSSLAFRSALILSTMILFVVETRGATCDGPMICCLTAVMTVYVYGCRGFRGDFSESKTDSLRERISPWFPQKRSVVLLMYFFLGVATLSKGPATIVMGCGMIGLFLCVKAFPGRINGNPLSWCVAFLKILRAMRPLTAAAIILIIAAPWYLAVGCMTDWEWTRMFFIEHNLERTVSPTRGHTGFGLSLLYYPVTSLFGTFPWSIFIVPFFIDLYRRLRSGSENKNAYLFLTCWAVFFFASFTLVSTKLPHYVVPAYPALAILGGAYFFHWRRNGEMTASYWTQAANVAFIVVGAGMVVIFHSLLPKYIPREQWVGLVLGLLPMTAGVLGIHECWRGTRKRLNLIYSVHAILFTMFLFQWAPAELSEHAIHRNGYFLPVKAVVTSGEHSGRPVLLGDPRQQPSTVYYADLPIRPVPFDLLEQWKNESRTPGELVDLLRKELIEREMKTRSGFFKQPVRHWLMEGPLFISVKEDQYHDLIEPLFGKKMKIVGQGRCFMKRYDHILLEWDPDGQ